MIRYLLCALAVGTSTALAGTNDDPVVYRLDGDSAHVHGCFGECLCPLAYAPLTGTFVLTPVSITGTFNEYDVSDVDWAIDLFGDHDDIPITGSGTYITFSEVVTVDQMELDLVVDNGSETHFASVFDLAQGDFPEILVGVSIGDLTCYDTLITVHAFPITPDIDRDGVVGVNDLVAVIQAWGTDDPWADVTMDGTVGVDDLVAVVQAWSN